MMTKKLFYYSYEQTYDMWGAIYAETSEEARKLIESGEANDLDQDPVGDIRHLEISECEDD